MIDAAIFFGADEKVLFHGSPRRVPQPLLGKGNPHNDYGLGFYCTDSLSLASEWACPTPKNGYVNEYRLSTEGLKVLDLSNGSFSALHWLAVLLKNRQFETNLSPMAQARAFLLDQYDVSLEGADIVHGYRADDSYYTIARAFLNNMISLSDLEKALHLGGLGYQTVLMSPKAFEALSFSEAHIALAETWYPKRRSRDAHARNCFHEVLEQSLQNDWLREKRIIDIMREVGC